MAQLQPKIEQWAIRQIGKRFKAICQSINEAIEILKIIFTINLIINPYKIPRGLYNYSISSIKEAIDVKFKRGICKEKSTQNNPNLFKQYQSYYLHNAPKNLCKWCFVPLLRNIANYIENISLQNMENIHYYPNDAQIHDLLKKMFLQNLMNGHIQMDKQSTKNGPIIQYSAWRHFKLQEIINKHYDCGYQQKWNIWMTSTDDKGNKIRINSIITNKMIPFTTQRLLDCLQTLSPELDHNNINIRDFHVKEIEDSSIDNYIDDGSVFTVSDAGDTDKLVTRSTNTNINTAYIDNAVSFGDQISCYLSQQSPFPSNQSIQNPASSVNGDKYDELNKIQIENEMLRERIAYKQSFIQPPFGYNEPYSMHQQPPSQDTYYDNYNHCVGQTTSEYASNCPQMSQQQIQCEYECECSSSMHCPTIVNNTSDYNYLHSSVNESVDNIWNGPQLSVAPNPNPMQYGYQGIHRSSYNHIESRVSPMSCNSNSCNYNQNVSIPAIPNRNCTIINHNPVDNNFNSSSFIFNGMSDNNNDTKCDICIMNTQNYL